MSKPKIIIFTTSYYPFIGGAEIAIHEIMRRLKDRFDFYIVTARFRRDLPKREVRPEGTVIRLGFGTRLDKYLLPFFTFWNLEFGIWNFQKQKTLLLGVDIGQGSLAAAIYKFFHPKTPFILNIQYGEGDRRVSSGRFGVINLAFRFMLGRADFVTAISSYLLDLARSYGYNGPGEVIQNGVDIRKFQNTNHKSQTNPKAQNTKSKTIVTTSRLVPKNGVDILIKAIAEVKKQTPDVQLHIVGDGPEKNNYQLLIINNHLQNNVKLFGAVPYEEIPKYLHQADIFARPSRSEGMGNSFIEALAAGLPIIGTPVGGITDIIKDGKTGLFVKPEDPHDLAEKIVRLLQDKELAKHIAENGKKMVEERFSWDKISASYGRLFFVRHSVSNILIATPLLPPQLGGPALYAKNLAEEFSSRGHKVKIVSFGKYLKFPSGIRHLLYLLTLARQAMKSDLIFALDYTSVGFPAAIASLIFRKPLVIRVEGDFLWEGLVERARIDVTLKEFYKNPPPLTAKESIIKRLSGWVMRRASKLVFSSEWRRGMVIDAYNIPLEKTVIIRNVFPHLPLKPKAYSLKPSVILWAGRMLYLKNLQRLIHAFASIEDKSYELHLVGDGPEKASYQLLVTSLGLEDRVKFFDPMSRRELAEKLAASCLFALPSLSEVGPNVIADSISAGTPFVMTGESGYAEYLKDYGLLTDPLNEADILEKLETMLKQRNQYREKLSGFPLRRGWNEAAEEWAGLFKEVTSLSPAAAKNTAPERILVIGRDLGLTDPNSEVSRRVKEYRGLFEEYQVISAGMAVSSAKPFSLLFSWIGAVFLGKKIIKKHRIQLIDAQDPAEAGLVAFFLSKITGVPFRLQIHTDIFSPWYRQASWKEGLRWRLAKFLIPRANCIRAVSERIQKSVLEAKSYKLTAKISVLPIFTDVSRFLQAERNQAVDEGLKDYDFKMIAVGRFVDKEKNFSLLIEVMSDFVKVCPKSLLVLVGSGPDEKTYKLQTKSYNLEKNVTIEPWRDDLPSFYKSFDLFLLSSNYEGWGRTAVEALAVGLPIVMTDVGLAGEVVKNSENGVVVPVKDKEKFLEAVRDLYQNPDQRNKLALAGQKTAKELKPASKNEYLTLYKESFLKCVPLEIQDHL